MLIHQKLTEDAPSPRKFNAAIPRDLETICLKCLERDPEQRYETAALLQKDLQHYLEGASISARPIGRLARGWRWCKRRPVVAGLSVLLVTALLSGTAISAFFAAKADQRADELAVANVELDTSKTQLERSNAELSKSKADLESAFAELTGFRERDQQRAYLSQMQLASRAWEAGNISLLREILNSTRLAPGDVDRRRFEWYYWWQLANPERQALFPPRRRPEWQTFKHMGINVAVSRSGSHVAAILKPGGLTIIDPASQDTLSPFELFQRPGRKLPKRTEIERMFGGVVGLAFTPNGQKILVESYVDPNQPTSRRLVGRPAPQTRRISFWDRETAQLTRSFDLFFSPAQASVRVPMAMNSDGTRLAVVDFSSDYIFLLDANTGEIIQELDGADQRFMDVEVSPNASHLLSISRDGTAMLWDASTGKQLRKLRGPPIGGIVCAAFSPDAADVITGCEDGSAIIWKVAW